MERNMSELSNVDRLKLAELLITVRDSVANNGPASITGYADEREHDAKTIALKRAQSASAYLQRLGVASSRINIDTKIWRANSQVPYSERDQIEVEFEPACGPNGCASPCGVTEPTQ
jgi:hypothetical protein